ncbi:hypothetical protein ABZ572_30870 [Streptomyces sp. NPDC018338]|uniref:hypothetical protein n=1 Tax=Streptomyces sp. NPDC018338 TaxID=3157192 RepID=UPI0034115C36
MNIDLSAFGGGGAVRDGEAVEGAEFGEACQFVLVETHGLIDARGQVIARHRAVQLQQRRLDGFGDRRGEPRVTVQDQMAVQATDPPQQDGWEPPFTGLLAVRLDPAVVAIGHRPQRKNLPRMRTEIPVDGAVRMTVDEHRTPILGMRGVGVAPTPERSVARKQPPALMQRAGRRVDEVSGKAVSPPFRAACQGAPGIGAQRRDEGAELIGAPEVHALELLAGNGEQHRPRQLENQQPRAGGEHAQPRLVTVVHVQGQAHPRAVVPRDIAALHAESVDSC